MTETLWLRSLRLSARTHVSHTNRTAAARLALKRMLHRCGLRVTLVEIHTWSRNKQGQAYLWAVDYLAGMRGMPFPFERRTQ